jgi:DNA (cytosine-5)-methyltransferase 1
VDVFKGDDVASTESARQHKDAADLVCQPAYQETVGALTSSDRKGPNSQYVGQDKLIVDGLLLIRRLTPLECERLQGLCCAKENAKLFQEAAKTGTNPQNSFA